MGTKTLRETKVKAPNQKLAKDIFQRIKDAIASVETAFGSLVEAIRDAVENNIDLGEWYLNSWVDMALRVVHNKVSVGLAKELVTCSPELRKRVLALDVVQRDEIEKNGAIEIATRGSSGEYEPKKVLLANVPDRVLPRLFANKRARSFDEQVKCLKKRTSKSKAQSDHQCECRPSLDRKKVEIYTVSTNRIVMSLDSRKLAAAILALDTDAIAATLALINRRSQGAPHKKAA